MEMRIYAILKPEAINQSFRDDLVMAQMGPWTSRDAAINKAHANANMLSATSWIIASFNIDYDPNSMIIEHVHTGEATG